MNTEILIVQRFFYNFREGFLDYLYSINPNIKIINSIKSKGRVIVPNSSVGKKYFLKVPNFIFGENLVVFPFLFWNLMKIRPQIVVTEGGQNTINNIQIYFYCILFKRKYIQWDLGRGYKIFKQNIFRRTYTWIYKFIATHSSLIYGYNSGSKNYFLSLGFKDDKIVILNNTVDTISIRKSIKQNKNVIPDDIRQLYSPDKIYIIFVGALLPTKNIESLVDILNCLGENYHLLIIGSGTLEYESKLKKKFSDTNHSFLGYKKQDELLPYYKISSFSILPGLGGLAINQAMAFGVPVLCNKADGAENDIIIKGVNGFIYNDIVELVNFIQTKSQVDWKVMGANASNILYNQFSIESMTEKYLNGINRVLNV